MVKQPIDAKSAAILTEKRLGQYKGFIIWPKTFENFSLRDSTREIPSGQDIRAARVPASGRRQRRFSQRIIVVLKIHTFVF